MRQTHLLAVFDDVFVVMKSLIVKFLSIEWHWDRIFISDYRMFSLCLISKQKCFVVEHQTCKSKSSIPSYRASCCVAECTEFESWPQHIIRT